MLNFFSSSSYLKAAEKINIKFEEMSIPISIDQLSKLETYGNDTTEIIEWFKKNGFNKFFELTKFLEYPFLKEKGYSQQLLRSWMGREVLAELSNTIIIPNDDNGTELFNTIDKLFEIKKEINILDILKEIPVNEIQLDVDNMINIISSWKNALEEQQNLVIRLNNFEKIEKNIFIRSDLYFVDIVNPKTSSLNVKHRDKPLKFELWKPINKNSKKDLIIFMPGFGGDIGNFRWLGVELSKRDWPVLFIDHEGSNADAFKAVFKNDEALPRGKDIYLNRIKDLDAIIKANKKGYFGLKKDSYILMGHSLGTLVSFLYEGKQPSSELISRCNGSFSDFALTNLSKLLQCQLTESPLPKIEKSSRIKALIGFSGFGSIVWQDEKNTDIDSPILLIGGTYDLITPLISEQFKIFLANKKNTLSRFLIIEGSSHFSPVRVSNKDDEFDSEDIFKISQNFIGANPSDVQNLSLQIIIQFLNNLDKNKGLPIIKKQNAFGLDFHILSDKEIKQIYIED